MENRKEEMAFDLGYRARSDWSVTNSNGIHALYINFGTSIGGYFNITRNYKKAAVSVVRLYVYQNIGVKLYDVVGRIRVIDKHKPLTMENLKFKLPAKEVDYRSEELKKLSDRLDELAIAMDAIRDACDEITKSLEGDCIPKDL